MIFYLIYLSSASYLYSDSDLSDILATSRENNTAKDVTGLLLYHEGSILQILEGDEKTVMSVYNKIAGDDRHRNILKMLTGTSNERHFPDWSMGFKTVSNAEWEELAGYLELKSSAILSRLKQSNQKIGTIVNSFMTVNVR